MRVLMIIAMGIVIGGCSSQQSRSELGSSVQAMVEQQTFNPAAAQQNAGQIRDNLDGETGINILHTYREATGKPNEIKNEIQVNIGS